jgi:hypothetical protein
VNVRHECGSREIRDGQSKGQSRGFNEASKISSFRRGKALTLRLTIPWSGEGWLCASRFTHVTVL